MDDPRELVFVSKALSPSELKQEGFALVRNIAAHVHDWLSILAPHHDETGRACDDGGAAPPPPAPPPKPRNITAVLGNWTFANVPHPPAKVAPGGAATLSPAAEPFPTWHVGDAELRRDQVRPYAEPPGPKAPGVAFTSDPADPAFEHELTYEEYKAHNLEPLYWHQRRYKVRYGFKLPYVKRLDPEAAETRAILKAVTEARASLPELPVEAKGPGKLVWTKWDALGRPPRPLYGQGWMFIEDPKSDYSKWLYQQWIKGYAENLASTARLPHMAALRTLHQEGAPSSLNTYDSCIMSWGVGFACGAPQLIEQLIGCADFVNALYACGLLIQGFEPDGILKTIPGFHYQTLDLSDPARPKVLVWDNYYHFYGFAPGASGAEVAVRPRRYEDDAVDMSTSKKYAVKSANPQPQTNLELSYHLYNHMTNAEGRELDVLRAFVALARDERTREAVSEANRGLIVKRAMLALPEVQTEAAYTFVSMCKHNWGLSNAELTFDHLMKFLSPREAALLRKWKSEGVFQDEAYWTESSVDLPLAEFVYERARDSRNRRHVMVYNDALIAKAVVRKVVSLLEMDRVEEAKRRYLKGVREGRAAPVRLLDERLRKYSYIWRFDRIAEYWREMTTGENWLKPMNDAARIAGESSEALRARISRKAPEGYRDIPRAVPVVRFDDGFSLVAPRNGDPGFRGEAFWVPNKMAYAADAPDLKASSFYNLGPRALMNLPWVVAKHGQDLELLHVEMETVKGQQKINRMHWQRRLRANPVAEEAAHTDEALAQQTLYTDKMGNEWVGA